MRFTVFYFYKNHVGKKNRKEVQAAEIAGFC